ncbi:hypothetical protein OA93_20960 [Flavobacterium sp. KMS]|uniref:hypothetical protein n=1 Tax=Flavobacterium sp. KMS TaxID=1566023 RepID=UPI00057CB1FC|nr:hypothetical protein [Flavobacterium sp. KMS]KIA93931.1 hypothetical protein OA93_20960 [Flavobacterium sp. KMS]
MIKLHLGVMNGIIYRLTIFSLFIFFGCKNDSKIKENSNDFNIKSIKLITVKDTLFLKDDNEQFGEEWRDYVKDKEKYNQIFVNNKKFDKETEQRFKKSHFLTKESIEYLIIKRRINLHSDFNTLIVTTPETFILLNYNSKDELIDFLDLSKFNQQICQCTSKVYIDKKGVIHCQIESGKPFHPYVNYKVNDKGKFEIVDQFTPPNEEKMSSTDRLEYIIKKTTPVSGNVNLKSYLESDEFTTSNTTFIDEKDLGNILFSKSHSSDVYKLFHDSIGEYTDDDKGINVLGKVSNGSSLLLICNLSRADQIGIIFILNKNHEITDYKIFSSDHPSADESISGLVKE